MCIGFAGICDVREVGRPPTDSMFHNQTHYACTDPAAFRAWVERDWPNSTRAPALWVLLDVEWVAARLETP